MMHKKSLYNRAVSLGMTESEYAVRHRMKLRAEDRFTVLIRGIPDQNFYVPDVRVP